MLSRDKSSSIIRRGAAFRDLSKDPGRSTFGADAQIASRVNDEDITVSDFRGHFLFRGTRFSIREEFLQIRDAMANIVGEKAGEHRHSPRLNILWVVKLGEHRRLVPADDLRLAVFGEPEG